MIQVRLAHFFSTVFLTAVCCAATAQTSYSLQKALQTARANNPILKTAQFNIGIAQTDIVTAGLRFNPIFKKQSLRLVQPSEFGAHTGRQKGQNRQVWWQLTQSFQVAGQRAYKIELANRMALLSEKDYTETERNLFAEVAIKWLEAWTARQQLALIEVAKNNIDSLVITNQLRYKNQVITQTDLFRTELLAKQYAIQYKTASQEVIDRQNELKFLLGVQDSLRIDTADSPPFSFSESLDNLLAQSLQYRSDLQTAQSLIKVSNSNIKLQKSLAFPQPELGVIWNPQNAVPYLGIYATIDLPISNRNQGEIRKSFLLKDQAEQQLFTIQEQIQTEISIAYANYRLQQQNLEDFSLLLAQSQSILDNVKYAYLRGGTTIIDFLEAQRSWLETQQQYHETMQFYRQSYIQLLYATGLINQLAQ